MVVFYTYSFFEFCEYPHNSCRVRHCFLSRAFQKRMWLFLYVGDVRSPILLTEASSSTTQYCTVCCTKICVHDRYYCCCCLFLRAEGTLGGQMGPVCSPTCPLLGASGCYCHCCNLCTEEVLCRVRSKVAVRSRNYHYWSQRERSAVRQLYLLTAVVCPCLES